MKFTSVILGSAAALLLALAMPAAILSNPQGSTTAAPRIVGPPHLPLVVIDPGHGGADLGAVAPGSTSQEKDVTLDIARSIRDELISSGRARVALTRDDDRFLMLRERYGLARRTSAALFISIHCDSAGDPETSGATAYTFSDVASDREAARLAARENKADVIGGSDLSDASADVSSILVDLTEREARNNSAIFARALGREAGSLMNVKPVFHRMASMLVLKAPDIPSVLFETGYMTNQKDSELFNSREGRKTVAQSVRRAAEVYFHRVDKKPL